MVGSGLLILPGVDRLRDGRGVLPEHHLGLGVSMVRLASKGGWLRIIIWGDVVLLRLADDDSVGIVAQVGPGWEVRLGLGRER